MLYQTAPPQSFITKPLTVIQRPAEQPKEPKAEEYYTLPDEYLEKIASDHHTTTQRLFNKNTDIIDPNHLDVGQRLLIPAESEVLTDRPMPVSIVAESSVTATPHPTLIRSGGVSSSGNFQFGWCTFYADQQRPDIHATGNAADWIRYANSKVPMKGAVAVNTWAAGGLGHVGIVVDFNATQVLVRSMNYKGFGVVTTDWVDTGYWQGYIL